MERHLHNNLHNKYSGINLFNRDAMNLLDSMIKQNIKVDMIFTDPPYRITARGNGGTSGGMFQKKEVNNGKIFKTNNLEIEDWLPKFYQVLKDQSHCYIMTNNKNITHYLEVIDKSDFHFIKNLIWVKDNKIMGQTYMSQFEYIIMLRKGGHKKINNCGTSDVLIIPNKKMKDENNKIIHDTEKPVELTDILVSNSSNEGDIVFDPFMGLGGCGISCLKSNRKFIGCELDERYFNIANDRIRNYHSEIFVSENSD